MTLMFHVLASGSTGNACLLEVDGFGVLIDFGVGPRILAKRLQACGASWDHVDAALLTHTHGDHWQATSLAELHRRRIPLYCHHEHALDLEEMREVVADMRDDGLIHTFHVDQSWELTDGCRCEAFAVNHDSGMTCGFRFDGAGSAWSLAHVTDLGCWDEPLADRLRDVDVLALEFNHDVAMQRDSGRPYHLIRRVLGNDGHLSNTQAAQLVRAVLQQSEPGRMQHLVQLHLSEDCNTAELARAAARRVVHKSCHVHTTLPDIAGPSLHLHTLLIRPGRFVQASLPGWE